MKRSEMMIAVLLLCTVTVCMGEAGTKVRVIGQRVNLRAKADPNSEVVSQAADGELLVARSFQGEWVEVVAPEAVDLWVHRDFVQDNRVLAGKLHVRGGPGINYTVVGELGQQDTIVRRGEFGEWVKIAPPSSCSLWVSRDYVETLQPEKPKPAAVTQPPRVEKPAAEAPPVAVSTPRAQPEPARPATGVVSTPSPATESSPVVPPDLKLIPLEGQGRAVQREGTLRLAGFVIGRPSRYRLVNQQGNRIETICYVRGNNSQLAGFVGQKLLVRGREYWVKGVRDPVVIPEQIVPRATE